MSARSDNVTQRSELHVHKQHDQSIEAQLSPVYDLFQSLVLLASPSKKKRESIWIQHIVNDLSRAQRQSIYRWFRGDPPLGFAYIALIPSLAHPESKEELLYRLATLSLTDFVRIALTAYPTHPEAPLLASDLTALQANRLQAQQFVDRYLSLSGRQRTHLIWVLTHAETARSDLLQLLQWYGDQVYQEKIEPELCEERSFARRHLQEAIQAGYFVSELSKIYDIQHFSPVVLAPTVLLDRSIGVYVHETSFSLLEGTTYEPLIFLFNTRKLLDSSTQGDFQRLTSNIHPPDPSERWAEVFSVLADPSRLRLLHLLAERPHYEQELVQIMHISGATVSHHVKVLFQAGLVRLERQSHRTYIVLHVQNVRTLFGESCQYILENLLNQQSEENHEHNANATPFYSSIAF